MHAGRRCSMAAEPRSGRTSPPPPPQATMGLLDYLTATSLDEDYAAAARRRSERDPASPTGRPGRAALVVLAVFGLLVATAALRTSRGAEESATSRASLIKQVDEHKRQLANRRSTVRALRQEVARLQSRELA